MSGVEAIKIIHIRSLTANDIAVTLSRGVQKGDRKAKV
jgi:hypothetical protein